MIRDSNIFPEMRHVQPNRSLKNGSATQWPSHRKPQSSWTKELKTSEIILAWIECWDERLKTQFRQARNKTLANRLEFRLVHKDQDPSFFIDKDLLFAWLGYRVIIVRGRRFLQKNSHGYPIIAVINNVILPRGSEKQQDNNIEQTPRLFNDFRKSPSLCGRTKLFRI